MGDYYDCYEYYRLIYYDKFVEMEILAKVWKMIDLNNIRIITI